METFQIYLFAFWRRDEDKGLRCKGARIADLAGENQTPGKGA
jgi:hypothetical protein